MKNKYLSKLLTLLSRQYTSHNSFTAFSMKSSNCYLDIQEEGGKKKKKHAHEGRNAANKTQESGWHLINASVK